MALIAGQSVFGQKQANNWYFGNSAAITFNTTAPSALTNSAMSTNEGVASISDTSGRLLFYTNGLTIYNRNHSAMNNGTGLLGDAISAQSAVVVPMPGNDSLYYVFTIPDWQNSSGKYFRYSIVDMKRNSGLGSVVVKNRLINTVSKEQITAVNHADGYRVWVITHEVGSNRFFSYLLTDTGLNMQAVVSGSGMRYTGNNRFGYLKASHNGKLLCTTLGGGTNDTTIQLFDFNPNNGVISNPRTLAWSGVQTSAYSCEFSFKDSFLYTASFNGADIYQYHLRSLNTVAIRNSRRVVSSGGNTKGCIQMGPDKKIYICQSGSNALAVLHAPDSMGSSSRFQNNYISLGTGRIARIGLPNFIQSFFLENDFNYTRNCINDTTLFITVRKVSDSVHWDFGDSVSGKLNYSNRKDSAKHIYRSPGKYRVRMISYLRNQKDTVIKEIVVRFVNPWIGRDTLYCNTSTFSKNLSSNRNYLEYNWSNGGKSKQINVSNAGTYILKVLDSAYCRLSDTVVIRSIKTKAKIKTNDSAMCFRGNNFTFRDNSSSDDSLTKRSWLIDNKPVGIDTGLNYNFGKAGNYRLVLKINSLLQCADSAVKTIKVHPQSVPSFEFNQDTQCFRFHDFSLFNNSQKNDVITYAIWTGSDGNKDTSNHLASRRFNTDGSYSMRLTLVSQFGCRDSISKPLWIMPEPNSYFKTSDDTLCFNQNRFSFTDSSTIEKGGIASWKWMNGDGSISTGRHQSDKRYLFDGQFEVKLITISEFGCTDTFSKPIIVLPSPRAAFEINNDTQCYKGHSFDLTNNSDITDGIISFSWDLADSRGITSKDITAKTYSQEGRYPLSLEVNSLAGCRDTAYGVLQLNASPKAGIFSDQPFRCFRGHSFDLENRSTVSSGNIAKYEWLMGDGNIRNSRDVMNYIYNSEDSFYVQMRIYSDQSCADSSSILLVTHPQPYAMAEIPNDSQCWQKNYFVIINKSTVKYGKLNYLWDFGDMSNSSEANPADKRYPNRSAEYLIKLRLTSDHGCTDSFSKKIVLLERPIAGFDINDTQQCLALNLFQFNNTSSFSAMNTLSYRWSKGDGNGNDGELTPDHVYTRYGKYTCSLIVQSSLNNCTDTVLRDLIVAPQPLAEFDIESDSQCLRGNLFKFFNKSSSLFGNMSFKWDAGNGMIGNDTNMLATYPVSGVFDVKLRVETEHGCSDSTVIQIVVMPQPKAGIRVNDSAQCLNAHQFDLTNESAIISGNLSFVWECPSGVYHNGKDLTGLVYNAGGFHQIKLAVRSEFGCTDTISKEVFLEERGGADIIFVANDSQCLKGNRFDLNIKKPGLPKEIRAGFWDMGDDRQYTGKNIQHTYKDTGLYRITLITESENGCHDTVQGKVKIHPHPVAKFTANNPCFPEPVQFTNLSEINEGVIDTYQWDFGAGRKSNVEHPLCYFPAAGIHDAALICRSAYGCADTLNLPGIAIVRPKPQAMFNFQRLADNNSGEIVLKMKDASQGSIISYQWETIAGQSTEQEPLFQFADSGRFMFRLIVTNTEGCSDTAFKNTGLIYPEFRFFLPTAFSPNDNVVNDTYFPVMKGYLKKYSFEIFNSWGEKLFESSDPAAKWDGTYMGNPCPQGVYLCRVFLIPFNGEIGQYATTFTLLR